MRIAKDRYDKLVKDKVSAQKMAFGLFITNVLAVSHSIMLVKGSNTDLLDVAWFTFKKITGIG